MKTKVKNNLFTRITIIGAVLLFVMLLLPYATAKRDYKEKLLKYPNYMYEQEINMTCEDAVNLSLVEYVRAYKLMADRVYIKDAFIAAAVIIIVYAVFSFLTLLFSIFKKTVGIIIFDGLAMFSAYLIYFDNYERGSIGPNSYSYYNFTYAYLLIYVVGAIVLAGAVGMLIEKRKLKKQKN